MPFDPEHNLKWPSAEKIKAFNKAKKRIGQRITEALGQNTDHAISGHGNTSQEREPLPFNPDQPAFKKWKQQHLDDIEITEMGDIVKRWLKNKGSKSKEKEKPLEQSSRKKEELKRKIDL